MKQSIKEVFEKNLSTEAEPLKDSSKIEIDLKLLKRIAEYYEFPLAVFLMQEKDFNKNKDKTRDNARLRKIIEFERKLRGILEDYFGDFR